MPNPEFSFSSDSNEWYTPAPIIECVHRVLGFIDLDPASCSLANKTVNAQRCYSLSERGEDALNLEWHCQTLFVNPPYGSRRPADTSGRPTNLPEPYGYNQDLFMQKLLVEFYRRHIADAAIMLCNAGIGDEWFGPAWKADARCFPKRRVRFDMPDPDDRTQLISGPQPTKGNCLILWSHIDVYVNNFIQVMYELGPVIEGRLSYAD